MTPERQRHAFQLAQKLAAQQRTRSALSGQNLGAIGESLYCYVPRRLRDVGIDDLLAMSFEDVASLYDAGSWAINDLIRLLERFADDAGAEGNSSVRKLLAMTMDADWLFEGEFIRAVPLSDSEATDSAEFMDSPPLLGDKIPDALGAPLLNVSAACENDEAMRAGHWISHAIHHFLPEIAV